MDAPMIWVISHDPDTRRLIGLNMSKRGLRIQEISPQEELAHSGGRPHLIILDTDPPGGPGWEVAGTLRHSPSLREVPLILVLTAAPTASRLASLRPVRWVEKPLAMDTLLALVRESLARQGTERKSQTKPI